MSLSQATQDRRALRAVEAQRDQLALALKAVMINADKGNIKGLYGPLHYLCELALRQAPATIQSASSIAAVGAMVRH